MKKTLTDQIRARMLTLLDKWENQSKIVRQNIENYVLGEDISKIKISKDVSKMKDIFKQIDLIMKELK